MLTADMLFDHGACILFLETVRREIVILQSFKPAVMYKHNLKREMIRR